MPRTTGKCSVIVTAKGLNAKFGSRIGYPYRRYCDRAS